MLWDRMYNGVPDNQIYAYLKAILCKVTSRKETREEVFTTKGIASLLQLLSQKSHSVEVYILAISLIGVLANAERFHRSVVKKGLICHIVGLLDRKLEPEIEENPTGPHAQLQIQLYHHLHLILLYFSTGPLPSKEACLFEGIVPKVLDFFTYSDNLRSRILYGYDSYSNEEFSKLITSKHLVAVSKTVQISEETDKFWYDYLKRRTCDATTILKLNKTCCKISSLVTKTGDKEIDIPKELVKRNAAWPCKRGKDEETQTKVDQSSHDLHICYIVNPEYFFAHVGENTKSNVSEIQRSIDCVQESRRKFLRRPPKSGVFVGAVHEEYGSYRGIVIQSSEARSLVYSLDFGFISETDYKDMFLLTDDLKIPPFPPQATLCRLEGLKPKLLNTPIAVVALKALSNLSCMEVAAVHFFTPQIVHQMCLLSRSPDKEVVATIYKIFANLCKYESVREILCEEEVVSSVLENLQLYQEEPGCKKSRGLAQSGLGVLVNLFFHSDLAKAQLVNIKGLDVLVTLTRTPTLQAVRPLALKALRMFVGVKKGGMSPRSVHSGQARGGGLSDNNDAEEDDVSVTVEVGGSYIGRKQKKKPPSAPVQKPLTLQGQTRDKSESGANGVSERRKSDQKSPRATSQDRMRSPVSEAASSPHSSLFSSETDNTKTRVRSRSRSLGKARIDDDTDIFVRARLKHDSDTSDEDGFDSLGDGKRSSNGHSTGDESANNTTDGETLINSKPKVVNSSVLYKQQTCNEYYVQDSEVDFIADERTEIRTTHDMSRVSATILTKIAIGFLNSGSAGRMYFGIRKGGIVKGNHISHSERDEFRQGVDRVFEDRIVPKCHHNQYCIKFIPVVRRLGYADPTARLPIKDTYVIEILIKQAPKHILYISKDNESFLRNGSETVQASAMDIHTRAIEDLEEDYLPEIKALKMEISRLKKST